MKAAIRIVNEAITAMKSRKKSLCLHVIGEGLHQKDCNTAIEYLKKIREELETTGLVNIINSLCTIQMELQRFWTDISSHRVDQHREICAELDRLILELEKYDA